ncbi:MAG: PHP domain-containing protein [Chloroflexi bacterium]|nr:PHP domain-containing protein [Chloroflexota bacterium]
MNRNSCYNDADMLFKVDLHIHSPVSTCHSDTVRPERGRVTQPRDIIDKAIAAGLDAIAVTDHNTIKGLPSVIDPARGSSVRVIPGVEISAQGGHVLALWEQGADLGGIQDLLARLGFNGSSEGEGYVQTGLLMDAVFQAVHDAGGLAIAAHIDRRPKGFMACDDLSLAEKQKIYGSPFLGALEITITEDRKRWNEGNETFRPGMACIQGSDAHAIEEIGRRPVYLEIPDLSLKSLALAFKEFNSRVFFPSDLL